MSEIVDQVLDSVTNSEPSEVVVQDIEESTPDEPVVEEPVVEESPSTPITTQEVIQNVLEILSSTEKDSITTSQSEEVDQTVDNNELENRMIILEERLDIFLISKLS